MHDVRCNFNNILHTKESRQFYVVGILCAIEKERERQQLLTIKRVTIN